MQVPVHPMDLVIILPALLRHIRRYQTLPYLLLDMVGIRQNIQPPEPPALEHFLILHLLPFEDPIEYYFAIDGAFLLLLRLGRVELRRGQVLLSSLIFEILEGAHAPGRLTQFQDRLGGLLMGWALHVHGLVLDIVHTHGDAPLRVAPVGGRVR